MMNAMDQTDTPAVIVRCLDSDTVVRLYNRWRPDKDSIHYAVEACAPGLSARIDEAVAAKPLADLDAKAGVNQQGSDNFVKLIYLSLKPAAA